jgi:two-component sensor histidine kinase
MTIEDNGIGLPDDFKLKSTNTLGLQLVNSLVTQLDGEVKITNKTGTRFEINFKGLNLKNKGKSV